MPSPRYALYYAPRSDEPLAAFARSWLGRDAEADRNVTRLEVPGVLPAQIAEITAEPRRYGFHGTLKPPFALAAGAAEDALVTFAADFARRRRAFVVPALRLTVLAGFVALVPDDTVPVLDELAADCVREFDRFRAPPCAADLARRRQAGLTARQEALLVRWGYPYVLEEYRFHLTLTGKLKNHDGKTVRRLLESLTAPLCGKPVPIRDVVVFYQDDRARPFRVIARLPLGATQQGGAA